MANTDTQKPRFVAYYRVSTEKQGKSGLGLEAQREAVARHVQGVGGELIAPPFEEIESGKRSDNRPELAKALAACRRTRATLIVAKLDRLSRNVAFLSALMESKVDFVCADNPHATRFNIHILSAVAEHEREMISERTKAALKAAKARGTKLGGFRAGAPDISQYRAQALEGKQRAAAKRLRDLADELRTLKAEGFSLQAIARHLNAGHDKSPNGGQWTATAVKRALARLGRSETQACAITTPTRSRMVEAVSL